MLNFVAYVRAEKQTRKSTLNVESYLSPVYKAHHEKSQRWMDLPCLVTVALRYYSLTQLLFGDFRNSPLIV